MYALVRLIFATTIDLFLFTKVIRNMLLPSCGMFCDDLKPDNDNPCKYLHFILFNLILGNCVLDTEEVRIQGIQLQLCENVYNTNGYSSKVNFSSF